MACQATIMQRRVPGVAARTSTQSKAIRVIHCKPRVACGVLARAQTNRDSVCAVEQRTHSAPVWRAAAAATAAAIITLAPVGPAPAMQVDKVAEFAASGLIFKDSVEITSIQDPDVQGVTLYVSDFKRSIADKLAKDFFSEPSQASITCAVNGPVFVRNGTIDKLKGEEGQELFAESKGFNLFKNKTLRIRRAFDAKNNNLIYVAYSTRLSTAADDGVSSGRYRTSICVVPLPDSVLTTPTPAK